MPREVHVPSRASSLPFVMLLGVLAIVGTFVLVRGKPAPPPPERIEVRGPPDVIVAMHDLARLETASFHVEKVIEISDKQESVFGLIDAKDALLLIAVGEVVAGVDLEKLDAAAVQSDWAKRTVTVTLPAPEIFHARLDNAQTRVYSRTTDTFATRNESLEGKARLEAETSMRETALKGGILPRARAQAERTVRAMLRSMGFEQVQINFREKP